MKGEQESDDDKKSRDDGPSLPSTEVEPEKHDTSGTAQAHKPKRLFRRKNRWILESVIGALGVLIVAYYSMQAKRQADAMIEANRAMNHANEISSAGGRATMKAAEAAERAAANAATSLEEARKSNKTSADALAEMRHANRDATRARLEFVDASVDNPAQVEDPQLFFATIVNIGHIIAPWYITERRCFDYLPVMPAVTPCPENLGPAPGRKALPLSWEVSQISAIYQVGERIMVHGIRDRSPEMLADYLAGRTNVYWFVSVRYADGLGGVWRIEGCWYLTKRNEEIPGAVLTSPGQHNIFVCKGFPRETEITGMARVARH